jgi:hypothetical protein
MKVLLPLIICSLTITANAQLNKIDIEKLKGNSTYQKIIMQKLRDVLGRTNTDSSLASNTSKPVELLPLSYYKTIGIMPCIKPDTKDIAPIPNAWKEKVSVPYVGNAPRMPNATPYQTFQFRDKKWVPITTIPGRK